MADKQDRTQEPKSGQDKHSSIAERAFAHLIGAEVEMLVREDGLIRNKDIEVIGGTLMRICSIGGQTAYFNVERDGVGRYFRESEVLQIATPLDGRECDDILD